MGVLMEFLRGKDLQTVKAVLEIYRHKTVVDLITLIDREMSARGNPVSIKMNRKQREKRCPECGGYLRYCSVTRVHECQCGWSEMRGV